VAETEQTRLSEGEIKQVSAQLERVLDSSYFHGSERCTRFLRYAVEHVLAGCGPRELKERIIGIEVFNRVSDYDTAQDSTVRVTANEVRKRLAQYYNNEESDNPIIELPAGSYAVIFRWKARQTREAAAVPREANFVPGVEAVSALKLAGSGEPEPVATESDPRVEVSGRRSGRLLAASLLFLVVLAAIVYAVAHRRYDATAEVWAPLLHSREAITICVAEPIVYRPWSRSEVLSGPKDYMVPLSNAVTGIGDAYALADISGFLGSRNKAWRLLPSSDTSFRSLTTGPVILIGSFSNSWAKRLLGDLRYVFVEGPPSKLVDRAHPANQWTIDVSPEWTLSEDYAIISRFKSPDTGETIIALGGASNFGTEAAGEFLTNSEMLATVMRDAPKDWRTKNFQVVLHVKVQGSAPEPPTVVARYFW
jgi:hypothetical protein